MTKTVNVDIYGLLSDPDYLVGKAWHMDVNDSHEAIEAQKWLFIRGFKWPDDSGLDPDRKNLQSIWRDNIDNKTFTGCPDADRWGVGESLDVVTDEGIDELYTFTFKDITDNTLDSHTLFDTLDESENIHPFVDEDPMPIKYPQTGDYLLCHTDLVMERDGVVEATKGESYVIISTDYTYITIKDNSGDRHDFEKRGSQSYREWFTWVPKEYMEKVFKTDFFDGLNENFKREYDYSNIQFTLIENGKTNGVVYTINGRCKPDWVSQTDPEGWIVSWENHMPDPYAFVHRARHMKSCIQTETIVRNFNDGTYVPVNLASSDEVLGLFDRIS